MEIKIDSSIRLFSLIVGVSLYFLIFSGCVLKKNHQSDTCDFKLYLSLGNLPKESKQLYKEENISTLIFVNGRYIDENNDGIIDEKTLRKHLRQRIKSDNTIKKGVLDLEGVSIKNLSHTPVESPEFKKAVKAYIKAYQVAKSEFPEIEWGIYSIPIRNYWGRNQKWHKRNEGLKSILAETDIIYPSVYDFYRSPNPKSKTSDSLYIAENVSEALKYGKEFNKPVLPFLWHRIHNSNKKHGLDVIPVKEFKENVEAVLKEDYEGKKVSGVVWWGADKYMFKTKHKKMVSELKSYRDINSYQNELIKEYTSAIKEEFYNECKRSNL